MSNIQIIYKSNFHPIKIIKNYITNSFDAWEQRKLGVLGSVAMNKRIFKEETSDNGEIPFINSVHLAEYQTPLYQGNYLKSINQNILTQLRVIC